QFMRAITRGMEPAAGLARAQAYPTIEVTCKAKHLQKTKGSDASRSSNDSTALAESGRLDLNQRPLAPQASALQVVPRPDVPPRIFAVKAETNVRGAALSGAGMPIASPPAPRSIKRSGNHASCQQTLASRRTGGVRQARLPNVRSGGAGAPSNPRSFRP